MLRTLLRLLLCLSLVANATAAAWASAGMALPAVAEKTAAAMPCHEMAGMASEPAPDEHALHGKAAADPHHAPSCCQSGSCDCLQHCSATLALATVLPAAIGDTPLNWALHASRGAPSPYRPVRPPIV
ncbi:MAG TPA: hypothetical protein DDZ67_02615 [Xanthomonadaceae bacterium]|nr:hypothetical protein [Xanthomonadaceae bacterium]